MVAFCCSGVCAKPEPGFSSLVASPLRRRTLNLALQGGGALGAFTWGVLDRLLEEENLGFEGVSGASAGSMNALALAQGLTENGREGAKQKLEALWTAVGALSYPMQASPTSDPPGGKGVTAEPSRFVLGLAGLLSPYQFNPFDINPLRSMFERLFDFEQIRRASPMRLFIAATHVKTGALRIFHEQELTVEHLLASACLPALHHAILVDGEAYWDGGYSGNPPLHPLVNDCSNRDLMIVLLMPLSRPAAPTTGAGIRSRLIELQFNTAFLTEMRHLALNRRAARRLAMFRGRQERRLLHLNLHMIQIDDGVNQLEVEKMLDTSMSFMLKLKEDGRRRAESWLLQNRASVGRHSTLDLNQFAV
jgi:NTE family protein